MNGKCFYGEKIECFIDNWSWVGLMITLLVCLGFDFSSRNYWGNLEKVFAYDTGNMVTIVTVIWTFTVTMSAYFFEKREENYYGIRMGDMICAHLGERRLKGIAVLLFSELFGLILSALLDAPITLAVVSLAQFSIMIYLCRRVYKELSRENIENRIIYEITHSPYHILEKRNESMFYRMLSRMDYQSKDNVAFVDRCLLQLYSQIQQKDAGTKKKELDNIRLLGRSVATYILDADCTKNYSLFILRDWMITMKCLELKQGVVMAIFDELSPKKYDLFFRMMASEKIHYKELYVWAVTYNTYLQSKEGEQWRYAYTDKMTGIFPIWWDDKFDELAIRYWQQLMKQEKPINYDRLFKIIFSEA